MKIYFMLLLLAVSGYTFAQHTLSGIVTTSLNQPLTGAHIHLDNNHTVTMPDGSYTLGSVPTGKHRIVASYIGYKSLDTLVDIYKDITLNVQLKPETTQLEEVVLTENYTTQNTTHENRLEQDQIEKYSSATLGDALREIPGVSTLKTGSAIVKPVINGLHSSRVPVFSNGVRLEDQQWGAEHAPNIDINAAGKVTVIKGAAGLQYSGDAVGGLVLVEPLSVLKDTLFGKTLLTANSNGRGGAISSSLHKGAESGWAYNVNGTLKYMGDRQAPDYVISNSGNREGNFAGNVKYLGDNYLLGASYSFYNAEIGIAAATHIGNVADLVRAINSQEPSVVRPFTHAIGVPKQQLQHHLAKLNYKRNITDNQTLSLQYAFQLNKRKEYDIRRGALADVPALDLTLVTHSANADWKKEQGDETYKAGISAAYQHNNASPDTGVRPLIPNYTKYDAGAYGIYTHHFANSITGEAGLRYDFSHVDADKYYQISRWDDLGYDNGSFDNIIVKDYGSQYLTNPKFTYHNVSASLGLRKQFNHSINLLGNLSLAMRNPNPSELFSDGLHHGNATIELGDLRIKKEQSVKASATLLKTEGDFTFEVTPYINSIRNFIYLQPTKVEYSNRGTFPVYHYRQTNALLTGADVHVGYALNNHLQYTFNGAYVYGQNSSSNTALIDMPPPNISNIIRYTWIGWHEAFAELQSEAIFTQKRYPNYNFYADVPQDGALVPTYVNISTPPAGYHLLHLSSGCNFKLGNKTGLAVKVSVYNLFNTTYRDYLNRQRLYTDEPGRNIQLQLKLNY
ncbi:TonB-dependent receptor [Flavobacterium rhizosphaerae]|uniref:TonB-dependent receptor n=1 Tax=Flavobacterium rhizosphaerae TaxID=3163298 RepID=A0ABW8Z0X2_9FLAO